MNLIKKSKWRMIAGIIIGILIVLGVAGIAFVNQPSFGRLPKGERLERIKRSPQYRDGAFQNQRLTEVVTSEGGRLRAMWKFLFSKPELPHGP